MDKYRKLLMHLNYRAVDFSKSLFLEARFHPDNNPYLHHRSSDNFDVFFYAKKYLYSNRWICSCRGYELTHRVGNSETYLG